MSSSENTADDKIERMDQREQSLLTSYAASRESPVMPAGGRESALDLYWLPQVEGWPQRLKALDRLEAGSVAWSELVALANTRMDFVRTGRLDHSLQRLFATEPPTGLDTKPVRLAILGSSTVTHLLPSLRVAIASVRSSRTTRSSMPARR